MKAKSTRSWQIRICQNTECGLRYPINIGSPFGERCPACLGSTKVVENISPPTEDASTTTLINPSIQGVLVDNVRSAQNVGSIIRTAEGFGIPHIYLCGITPTPENKTLRKTALGAENNVNWTYSKDAVKKSKQLLSDGFVLWSLETSAQAKSILSVGELFRSAQTSKGLILVVGNEEAGIDPGLLRICQEVVFIPMHGKKKSYNVSVAFGIAMGTLTTHLGYK